MTRLFSVASMKLPRKLSMMIVPFTFSRVDLKKLILPFAKLKSCARMICGKWYVSRDLGSVFRQKNQWSCSHHMVLETRKIYDTSFSFRCGESFLWDENATESIYRRRFSAIGVNSVLCICLLMLLPRKTYLRLDD